MLDANVFNRLADGKLSFDDFRDLHLVATHVQCDELRATPDPAMRNKLLRTFKKIYPKMDRTSSAFYDVSKWDRSSWSPEDCADEKMLARLRKLDKKDRPENQRRDVLIGHTAIDINATLISDDKNLRQLVCEFRGRAISTSLIPAKNKTGR
jgi:hypothetical protein